MKLVQGIFLLMLVSACSDAEEKVKDLRGGDPLIEQDAVGDQKVNRSKTATSVSKEKGISPKGPTSEWSYEVVLVSDGNWGYQFLNNGTLVINQKTIPSIPGNQGFDSREKAERTAQYLIAKLDKGIFPPTVDKKELDSLGVLRD